MGRCPNCVFPPNPAECGRAVFSAQSGVLGDVGISAGGVSYDLTKVVARSQSVVDAAQRVLYHQKAGWRYTVTLKNWAKCS